MLNFIPWIFMASALFAAENKDCFISGKHGRCCPPEAGAPTWWCQNISQFGVCSFTRNKKEIHGIKWICGKKPVVKMIPKPKPSPAPVSVECSEGDDVTANKPLVEFARDTTTAVTKPKDLPPGRTRPDEGCIRLKPCGEDGGCHFADLNRDTGTHVKSEYRLRRAPDFNGKELYKASVNIMFFKGMRRYDSATQSSYAKMAQGCLDTVKEKMRGPNGEYLQIEIYSNPGSNGKSPLDVTAPPLSAVKITDPNTINYSNSWAENIPCETVVHETLHILGLIDEYPVPIFDYWVDENGKRVKSSEVEERKRQGLPINQVKKYDCRPLGPQTSIMAYSYGTYQGALSVPPKLQSVIYPAHFRAITQPGCQDVNQVFYECSSHTWETSFENPDKKCSPMPDVCKTTDEWLK